MSVEGSDPQSREGKKSQKVSDSHRNDVSPLTQGLRYRAACDASSRPIYICVLYIPACVVGDVLGLSVNLRPSFRPHVRYNVRLNTIPYEQVD